MPLSELISKGITHLDSYCGYEL